MGPNKRGQGAAKVARAWRDVWASPQGRVAIAELMVALNTYSEINPTDPMQAGIAIGERNVACRIARWIGRKPEDFVGDALVDVTEVEQLMDQF